MQSFKIIAQSYISTQRIAKVVKATSSEAALRSVWADLEDAGFYPVDAIEV